MFKKTVIIMDMSITHSRTQNRPAKNTVKVTLKQGPRRTLSKLRTILKANKYRSDLHQVRIFTFVSRINNR